MDSTMHSTMLIIRTVNHFQHHGQHNGQYYNCEPFSAPWTASKVILWGKCLPSNDWLSKTDRTLTISHQSLLLPQNLMIRPNLFEIGGFRTTAFYPCVYRDLQCLLFQIRHWDSLWNKKANCEARNTAREDMLLKFPLHCPVDSFNINNSARWKLSYEDMSPEPSLNTTDLHHSKSDEPTSPVQTEQYTVG